MSSSALSASAPRTPQRQRARSPIILTPRSKINAFLGVISGDDDSDDGGAKKAATPARRKDTPAKKITSSPLFLGGVGDSDDDDDEEEEEGGDVEVNLGSVFGRPTGGLVARMKGLGGKKPEGGGDGGGGGDKGRVSIFGGLGPELSNNDDDDDDVPVNSHRRKRVGKGFSPIRSSSPANKPSTTTTTNESSASEDEDLPINPLKNTRFLELVAKKRAEREAREAEEAAKQKERRENIEQLKKKGDYVGSSEDDDEDGNGKRKVRKAPQRKAGKKALEEMHKETQRLQRNMQLTHVVTTRKKVTKQSLFEKFGFKPPGQEEEPAVVKEKEKTPDVVQMDVDSQVKEKEDDEPLPDLGDVFDWMTAAANKKKADKEVGTGTPSKDNGKGKSIDVTPSRKIDIKGKGKAIASPTGKNNTPMPRVKVHLPIRPPKDVVLDDSDDLEIIDPAKEQLNEAKHLLAEKQKLIEELKPKRKLKTVPLATGQKPKMSAKAMHERLQAQSRIQAIQERDERIEELKSKGIIVQTAEEREAEMMVIENLVEKARLDALKVRKMEKRAERKKDGAKDKGDDEKDSSDDGDWLEGGEDEVPEEEWDESDEEAVVFGLSGAVGDGGEGGEDGDNEEEEGGGGGGNPMIDSAAKESDDEDAMDVDAEPTSTNYLSTFDPTTTPRLSEMPPGPSEEDSSDDDGGFELFKRVRHPPKPPAIEDDEDDAVEVQVPSSPVKSENGIPSIFQQKSPAKPEFAVPSTFQKLPAVNAPAIPSIFQNAAYQASSIGMSQLFAGSMAGTAAAAAVPGSITAKLDAARKGPDVIMNASELPSMFDDVCESVPGTQPAPPLELHYSQTQIDQYDSIMPDTQPPISTQDLIFATQEEEVVQSSPAPQRFAIPESPAVPKGTAPTQPLEKEVVEEVDEDLEPSAPKDREKKRRLMRKPAAASFSDEEAVRSDSDSDVNETKPDAFAVLKKAAVKKKKAKYNKSKSNARGLVNEQASESEDEYAGMGGASDDDDAASDDDALADEEMRDLLDDTNAPDIDASALAAFYAARAKAQDEKEVTKLFKDLQSGLLRKRRGQGAEFELDDSDDEFLAAERRRRAKRRQLAQVRKLLVKDSGVEKISQDPKKAAFFRVLEDQHENVDEDFLDRRDEELWAPFKNLDESQSQSQSQQESVDGTPVPEEVEMEGGIKTKMKHRRPVRTRKPVLEEVRETLSFLIEASPLDSANVSSDSEGEHAPDPARPASDLMLPRTRRRTINTAVIDRTTISRSSSSLSATTTSARLAFTSESNAPAGFRVPTLLRRATSSFSTSSGEAASMTERTAGESQTSGTTGGGGSGVVGMRKNQAKGGGRSVNFVAREKQRAAAVGGVDKKEKSEKKRREGEARRRRVGLGEIGGGRFT